MAIVEALLQELDQESKTTRRVLERVPEKHLAWKPHQKSLSLGQLALHVAQSFGYAAWAATDTFEFTPDMMVYAAPKNQAEILRTHDESVARARQTLGTLNDADLTTMWKAVGGGATVMEMPKAGLLRTVMMNHAYHHRGQLAVYLRLLDVPVPSIYGPTADEGRA